MSKRVSIKNWSQDERPREKLLEKGASALSDAELLAIIISSGTKKESALDISRNLLQGAGSNLRELTKFSFAKLNKFSGVGPVKAVTILALNELLKRLLVSETREMPFIKSSANAAKIIGPYLRDLSHEECWVMYLNRANRLISKERMSIGGVSSTIMDVKIVMKSALEKLASSIILVHNHPSGSANPGEHDKHQTRVLKEAASVFDIAILDHIIIAGDSYYSFADEGLMG